MRVDGGTMAGASSVFRSVTVGCLAKRVLDIMSFVVFLFTARDELLHS